MALRHGLLGFDRGQAGDRLRAGRTGIRALAASLPLASALVLLLFVWLHWYTSGTVVDLT